MTDGHTDTETDTGRHRPRLCIASRGKNNKFSGKVLDKVLVEKDLDLISSGYPLDLISIYVKSSQQCVVNLSIGFGGL